MKKNTIRLTESQLHNVIKESVNKILKEFKGGYKEGEGRSAMIYDSILEDYKAEEIAEEDGYESADEAAAMWFDNTCYEMECHERPMPKYAEFVQEIGGGELYHDFGAQYYFLVSKDEQSSDAMMY